MKQILLLLIIISVNPSFAKPLIGHIDNDPDPRLVKQCPKPDKRCPLKQGRVEFTHTRGYLGVLIQRQTGQLAYIYPESNLHKLGVNVGDFIIEINHQLYRPCILPDVSFYPSDSYLDITVRKSDGSIKRLYVKLINSLNFKGE